MWSGGYPKSFKMGSLRDQFKVNEDRKSIIESFNQFRTGLDRTRPIEPDWRGHRPMKGTTRSMAAFWIECFDFGWRFEVTPRFLRNSDFLEIEKSWLADRT